MKLPYTNANKPLKSRSGLFYFKIYVKIAEFLIKNNKIQSKISLFNKQKNGDRQVDKTW